VADLGVADLDTAVLGGAVPDAAVLVGPDLPVLVLEPTGDVEPALAAGIAAADAAADEGVDLLVAVGTGADVAAAAAVAALTDREPAAMVAAAADDAAWRREVVGVRDLLRLVRPHADTPYALLSTVDSAVLSALAGLVLQAAVRRTPVVLDGLAACAAAAVMYRLAPFIEEWWLVADRTGSPAQHAALDLMRLRPVFELGTAAGYAGPLVVPVLRAAARLATPDVAGD
jgi:nicotinate-nucleotide--dimethylbenzimidazole phosphoribosyltransferase